MIRYLLDTNVISELRKTRPHGAVLHWIMSLAEQQVFISAVTIGELQAGVELTRRQDRPKAEKIEKWLDGIAASIQTLPMDTACFRERARLMQGKPARLLEDAMIAATAHVHRMVLASRNEADFDTLGVKVFNPFKSHQ